MPCPLAPGPAGDRPAPQKITTSTRHARTKPHVETHDHRASFVQHEAASTGFQRSPEVNLTTSARSHKMAPTCTNAD